MGTVKRRLRMTFQNASQENMILFPCKKCGNINWHTREVVYEHLIVDGFIRGIILILITISMSNKMTWKVCCGMHLICTVMVSMLRDAFNMHSHGEQSFPPDFIASDDCNIGGNVFGETGTSRTLFDGTEEYRGAPQQTVGSEILFMLKDINFSYGKMNQPPNTIVQNTPNSEERNSEQQTVVGSSNVPETLDEPEEFQTESGGTRRVRGRTLLRDLYDLDPVERVKVISRNTHGQPVGSEARLLAGYLGILARNENMLPINYESWHHMPNSNKNQALANIKVTKCECNL
ncbi:hypothetical protein GOBAR_AA09830 [Gossypium barbadense]|uniref:Transposase-associated domain-containing protein n=1 Tax=Gossypium barbadense TaxID=3634 RepID=A0A2P5Y5C3_GOSBA|nr:hypothetical protein GOBAR_AA09830 [Gossypium barbadense]